MDSLEDEYTTYMRGLANKFINKLNINAKSNKFGEFIYNHNLYTVVNNWHWEHYYKNQVINKEDK